MLIHIKEISEGHSVIDQKVTMTEEQIREGGFLGAIDCHAEIEKFQFQIFLHVEYTCIVHQECSRCLNTFKCPVRGNFDIIVQDKNAPQDLGNDEVDYYFSDRDTSIDVRQSLYDEIMVSLSIKPLCKEECSGVEGYTGDTVDEQEESVDPRWEALKKLKNDTQDTT